MFLSLHLSHIKGVYCQTPSELTLFRRLHMNRCKQNACFLVFWVYDSIIGYLKYIWVIVLNIYEAASNICEATSNIYEAPTNIYKAASNIYETASNIYEAASIIYGIASNIYEAASNIYEVASSNYEQYYLNSSKAE